MSEGGDKNKSTFTGGKNKYNIYNKHKLGKFHRKGDSTGEDRYRKYLNDKKGLKDKLKDKKKDLKWNDFKGRREANKDYKNDLKKSKKENHQTIGGKLGHRANRVKGKLKNRFEKTAKTTMKIAKNVVKFAKLLWLPILLVLIAYNGVIIGIGISQGLASSPHYYCDPDAPKSIKSSSVYQQYCVRKSNIWGVDNINGHYIVQDGKGPAASCAILNMILRFYSIDDDEFAYGKSNVYSYLWQQDGRYTNRGNSVGGDDTGVTALKSIRQVLNNGASTANTKLNNNLENGTRSFALAHDKSNFTMSNWGYLRDESIDYEDYMLKSDFYDSQADNDKWVWDLSLDNMAEGTSWLDSDFNSKSGNWDFSVRMGVTRCNIETFKIPAGDKGYEIFKNRIDNILVGTSEGETDEDKHFSTFLGKYYKGSAGVVLQYTKTYDNPTAEKEDYIHTILITKKEVSGNGTVTWYGVDSSLGTAGGWEGPLDGTGRFVVDDVWIAKLLNGSSNSVKDNINGATYTVEKIAYCTHNRFF